MLSSAERGESPNYTKQLEGVQDFTANWSANFVVGDGREESRMEEAPNGLASLISSLIIGSEDFLIEEYVQLVGEKIIVDAKYNMVELVDLAWGRKNHKGLGLNEGPM